jgi:uncharacterized membrane protein
MNFLLFLSQKACKVALGVAVAGWQWYQSIQRGKAVRMVVISICGCGCGGGWVAVDDFFKFGVFCYFNHKWHEKWHLEWQWQGGSGTSRFIVSRRFEWYQIQRVAVAVAVAGWQ